MRRQLQSLSNSEPKFLGYAEDDHRLAKKDFGIHRHVPMFQFEHFKHGSMEMTTRDTLNGTFITAAYSGHPTHLLGRRQIQDLRQKMKRQEVYDHEMFETGVLEARFDGDASEADPASINSDAGTLFNTFEPDISCFMKDDYKDKNILDVQMYDKTNKATFGFGKFPNLSDTVFNSNSSQALWVSTTMMMTLTQLKTCHHLACLCPSAAN